MPSFFFKNVRTQTGKRVPLFFSGSDQLEKNFCRDLCFVEMFVLLFFIVVMFVAPVLWLVSLAAVRLYLGGEKLNGMKHIKWEMGWD